MWLLVKLSVMGAVLAAGVFLVVDHTPSLKASIIEMVNPRAKEARLLEDLRTHLDTAVSLVTEGKEEIKKTGEEGDQGVAPDDSTYQVRVAQALDDARKVLDDVVTLNDEHSGTARQVVGETLTAVLADTSVTPTPVPQESAAPSPETGSQTPTPDPCVP